MLIAHLEAYSNAVKAHNGMKIFEAWGPHVKRFAMTCELSEGKSTDHRYLLISFLYKVWLTCENRSIAKPPTEG